MTAREHEATDREFDARWRSSWDGPPANTTVDFANLPGQPSFPAAESAVLGAVMLSPAAAAKLVPLLRSEHFTSQRHRDTFAAVHTLWENQQPIDPVLVHDRLRAAGHVTWGESKAAIFIKECIDATYFPGNGTSYAKTVLEYAARRRAVQAGVRIAQAAAGGRVEVHDLMRLVAQEVHQLADEVSAQDQLASKTMAPVRLGTAIDELRDELGVGSVHGPTSTSWQLAALGEREEGFSV